METQSSKKWMGCDRLGEEYLDGVEKFLNFAFLQNDEETIQCPCQNCVLHYPVNRAEAKNHLVVNGIMPSYDNWFCHGESINMPTSIEESICIEEDLRGDDMVRMIHDAFGSYGQFNNSESDDMEPNLEDNTTHFSTNQSRPTVESFEQLLKDADEELYPGCKKFSKLSILLHLYHIKLMFNWTNESFNALLGLLKDAFPEGEKLPPSYYETKKIVEGLGLKYKKIHVCPNDCMLFRNEMAGKDVNECSICGFSRWKNLEKKIPAKVLRYFPLKPRRLRRLFMSSKTSNNGYRFRTKQYEEYLEPQNSGVMVVSKTDSYASTSDNAPKSRNVTYYGRLNDIVELNYFEQFKVVLFKCDWVDVTQSRGGVKEDSLGFTLVNFSHLIHTGDRESHEPFIFASQAQQVIFVQDPHDHEWFIPRKLKPREIFDMGEGKSMGFDFSMQNDANDLTLFENICDSEHENNDWVRSGVDGRVIEIDLHSNPLSNEFEVTNDARNDNEYGTDSE